MNKILPYFLPLIAGLFLVGIASCNNTVGSRNIDEEMAKGERPYRLDPPSTSPLHSQMKDVRHTVEALYAYVWSPELFYKKESSADIVKLMDRLSQDFHRVDQIGVGADRDPGFEIALRAQLMLLENARDEFRAGNVRDARSRLLGLSSNCIACHSRYHTPYDAFGDLICIDRGAYEQQLSSAEFLFAAREFEKAADCLNGIIDRASAEPASMQAAMEGLKLWLLIEVRVTERFDMAAEQLEPRVVSFPKTEQPILKAWVTDLRALADRGSDRKNPLAASRELLKDSLKTGTSKAELERQMVKTLWASTLLHTFLEGNPTTPERREATYLLALGYARLPIDSLAGYPELYSVYVMIAYPGTEEASKAKHLYEVVRGLKQEGGSNSTSVTL